METKEYTAIGGIILLLVALSSGATYYIEKSGDYDNCRGEWIDLGQGKYECSKDGAVQICYEIEYRGSGWYRCWIGNVVNIEQDNQAVERLGIKEVCGTNGCVPLN